jgi:hypothetical protein
MSATSETPVAERQILIVGPYGVLGTVSSTPSQRTQNGESPQLYCLSMFFGDEHGLQKFLSGCRRKIASAQSVRQRSSCLEFL